MPPRKRAYRADRTKWHYGGVAKKSASKGPDFRAGTVYGRWVLNENGFIAKAVWRVHDPSTGELGVVKRARSGRGGIERFTHEVEVLDKLQLQSGVLRLLDRDPEHLPAWMVTEEATLLATHLGAAPDLHSVVTATAEVAEALVATKSLGYAHRDVKPDNLFHVRGRAVLGDFGLATGHAHQDLTMVGGKVGPANFNAPETMEWKPGTDSFPADVYSLAKTMWVLAAGDRNYPPPGPLLIRLPESDLTRYVGRDVEGLARLLELATDSSPYIRPTMEHFAEELREWLSMHSAGSTPRPLPGRRRGAFEYFNSAHAIEKKGKHAVLDRAVQLLLDGCRDFRPGATRVTDHPAPDQSELWERMSAGDPDWYPDEVIAKRLMWVGLASTRLVAVGILDGEDDLRYELEWQVRDPGAPQWGTTWQAERRVRLRLPSDQAARRSLQEDARDASPEHLSSTDPEIPTELADGLRSIARAASVRDAQENALWDASRARLETRRAAADRALSQLDELWEELTRIVEMALADDDDSEVRSSRDGNTWFLNLGSFWRLVVRVHETSTHVTRALLAGHVVVQTSDASAMQVRKSDVANVAATDDPVGEPIWQLIRVRSNDLGRPRVRTSAALWDGAGAASVDVLEMHFKQMDERQMYPSLMEESRVDLTVGTLLKLFVAEAKAQEAHEKLRPSARGSL